MRDLDWLVHDLWSYEGATCQRYSRPWALLQTQVELIHLSSSSSVVVAIADTTVIATVEKAALKVFIYCNRVTFIQQFEVFTVIAEESRANY